ncbi:hypothetical protein PsYK624_163820 [Phanerochaete sordida]|uniref:Uncharacterized protein n=1 Tax=Phanerochaete sordida TaxID=48140 RepID=A0A9P3GRC7_9APHY|nr:hypothetical protein PsYK624_163820 [Phanerochaete sordida]
MSLSAPSQWLANALTALLSAPHAGPPPHGAPPADADAFAAVFNRVFVRHARGLVGGREVDRDELMRALLALQAAWRPARCAYADCESLHRRIDGFHPEMGVKMLLTPPEAAEAHVLTLEACVAKQGGRTPLIKTLMLDGDPSLLLAA